MKYTRVGDIRDWPHLAELGEFGKNIDWFAKFGQRIYLVTKDDRVYVFGNQTPSQILFGVEDYKIKQLTQPTEILELQNKKIVKFASTEYHVLALSSNGKVYGWGGNDYGQLGVGNYDSQSTPVLMHALNNVVDIITVDHTSLMVTHDGYIFACGDNDNTVSYWIPLKVDIKQAVNLISTYDGTSVAINNNSQTFIWGKYATYKPNLLSLQGPPVSVATTEKYYFILAQNKSILRSNSFQRNEVEIFYNGEIKFKALYADQNSGNGFMIGESIDKELYLWTNANSQNGQFYSFPDTNDIVKAFALYRYNGYLPFMVKLETKKFPAAPTSTTPASTPVESTIPTNEDI